MAIIDDILTVAVQRLRTSTLITAVSRPNRHGDYTKKHYSVVVTHDDPEVNAALSGVGDSPRIAFDVELRLTGHIRQDFKDDSAIDAMMAELAEEIQDVITDDALWHTFDGNCINAGLGAPEMQGSDDDGTIGVTVPILATYRVFERSPKTLAG